ncbi:HNH endonuclease [Sulfitobacter sp.]|uniref:HNH endonuclease n=1 Tax=Sulfitobacter sp. TaxID=1903071 RepID=UPI003003654C
MSRPPFLCQCGKIVANGTRCACKVAAIRARGARHDQNRPTAAQRGYNGAWRKARKEYLAHHPACVMCKAQATTVDHIIPHKGDDRLFWDKANWQSLCTPCHNRHKQRAERN